MKKFYVSLFAFLSVFSLCAPAVAADSNNAPDTSSAPMMTVTTTTVQANPAEMKKKIGQVFEILMMVNMNEVNAGKVALKRSSNADVKKFAQLMVDDHGQNLVKIKSLSDTLNIKPMSSNKSAALKKMGNREIKQLDSVPAKKFDKVYMTAMVNGHQAALDIINNDLLPMASNPDVIAHLTATRDTVAAHLQMAKDILSKL